MDISVFVILFVFSIVQSIIGVGLLVFGTPTLMLLGYEFHEVLGIVLPASICISFIQLFDSNLSSKKFKREFNLYCLPFVFIGVFVALKYKYGIDFSLLVGIMLLVSALVRFSKKLEHEFSNFIFKNKKIYQVLMGLIHGLTNMGGGLLTLLSSSIHRDDKQGIRSGIAYGYFFMGLIQYIALLFFIPGVLSYTAIYYVILAAGTYLILGEILFLKIQDEIFNKIITTTIMIYGLILTFK